MPPLSPSAHRFVAPAGQVLALTGKVERLPSATAG
jgi:hypothetical protein